MKSCLRTIILISAFLVSACRQTEATPAAVTETIAVTATIANSTEPVVSATATELPTRTSTPVIETPWCIPLEAEVELAEVAFAEYSQAILAFLNDGGMPEALDDQLYQAGVANQPVAVDFADMTGDGRFDIVVSIYDPVSESVPPEGILLIYICRNGSYQIAYLEVSSDGWGTPGIDYLQDLNGNGQAELVTSSAVCGAHTCFEEVQVLAWNGNEFENHLDGETSDLPFPDVRVIDSEGDGVFDLELTGSGFGSVGAGPSRGVTRIWVFDVESGFWLKDVEIPELTNYRIHFLHDAETAARNEDYRQALMLYGRIIQDMSLEDWADPLEEQATLSAYALYKTGLIHYYRGNERVGNSTFDQLRSAYPPDSPQNAYIEMADAFQEAYEQGDFGDGCDAAREFAEENAELILVPLGPVQFGYASPELTPHDVCPWE